MTAQLNVDSIRKLRGSMMSLAYSFDMISIGVCTTRHWKTSGRLVQELNVLALGDLNSFFIVLLFSCLFSKVYSFFMLYC